MSLGTVPWVLSNLDFQTIYIERQLASDKSYLSVVAIPNPRSPKVPPHFRDRVDFEADPSYFLSLCFEDALLPEVLARGIWL